MLLFDVNVLVYAHRREHPEHDRYGDWLTRVATGSEPFGLSELACSGFVRVVTHPGAFDPPTSRAAAMEFIDALRKRPNAVCLRPGPNNWKLFKNLCEGADARGKVIADAYHAALAIEHGCEWVTADADFSRFDGLRWRHPLQAGSV